jgi:leader peptidase (prepilin peptidase)/N-methyltransferase
MEPTATRLLVTIASGTVGLLIGSFLNVVVYRLPRGESISRPPSHCPTCNTQLGAVENIPVLSWVALRGRCRHCRAPISVRYPLVELLTGVLFAGLALALPTVAPIAPLDAVVAATIAIGVIDLDHAETPPALGWIALVAAGTLTAVSLSAHTPGRLGWAGIGAGATVAAFGLHRALGDSEPAANRFPDITACAAWGWAAGWLADAGGITIGATLAILALSARFTAHRHRNPVIAVASAISIAVLVAGAIAAR